MKANSNKKEIYSKTARRSQMSGFSLVELVVVMVILVILLAITIPNIYQSRKLYKAEEQALKTLDLIQEAGQLALTRRRTMRLEIDLTANQIVIIDENAAGTAADDQQLKAVPLLSPGEIRINQMPTNVTKPNPPNYADATFAVDATGHKNGTATVVGNTVWAARFKSDGSVVNAAGNPISVNLYSWEPLTAGNTAARDPKQVKAITVFGGSGAVRYWKYDGTAFKAY